MLGSRRKWEYSGHRYQPRERSLCKNWAECFKGSALELPFEDNSFNGIHCSHVMQVFQPNEAQRFIKMRSRTDRQ